MRHLLITEFAAVWKYISIRPNGEMGDDRGGSSTRPGRCDQMIRLGDAVGKESEALPGYSGQSTHDDDATLHTVLS